MDILRRLAGPTGACTHVPDEPPAPRPIAARIAAGCFNPRLCGTCGHVGCCESQRGDARAHALAEGHPIVYQVPAPMGFVWCYDEQATAAA